MSPAIVSVRTYLTIFVLLMALLGVTVAVAYVDLGALNLAAAMTIAIAKAILIILFFMHLRSARKLTWVFAGAGFFWLTIMLVLAMSDYATRSWPATENAAPTDARNHAPKVAQSDPTL